MNTPLRLSRSNILRSNLIRSVVFTLMLSGCGESEEETSMGAMSSDGAEVYQQQCSACHGARGEGGTGRALNGPHVAEMSDAQLFMMSYEGIGSVMPSFKSTLTTEQIANVVEHLRTF